MLWKIHPENPQKRTVLQAAQRINNGEVLIVPTDTAYALACSSEAPTAIKEIYRIKRMSEDHHLSMHVLDVATASKFVHYISDPVYRFMKHHTPGPYTFILKANRNVDKRGSGKNKTVGIRIVDHPFIRQLLEQLDSPMVSTSITTDDEYYTDPEELDARYGKSVSAIIDDGVHNNEFSTIIDCTEGEFQLVRRGLGELHDLEYVDKTSE